MRTYGASVTPSPVDGQLRSAGGYSRSIPETTGCSRLRDFRGGRKAAASGEGYRYVLGSVLNQVLLHQSIIGLEAKTALDKYGVSARTSSSAARAAARTWADLSPRSWARSCAGSADYRFIAVEPASCPSLTRGALCLRLLRHRQGLPAGEDVHPGQRLHPVGQPRGRAAVSRHEPDALAAVPRRLYGGASPWSRRSVFEAAEHVCHARRASCPRRSRATPSALPLTRRCKLQGDRRGKDHPLRPDRHGLFRHDGVSDVLTTGR